ncbi:hypothetical protein FIBSPDRAFT_1051444 [Athelia psychrophila]|uniref:Uncharacterized protein n=1 Tax=Athelia psychrophila TaxID=1759441 RepID=A0A165Z3Z3_9AGAM|nr:hypothetical protein FIBSPDRAFT_1051444 [Fibularhizoctonia sp. CBS 109695]
MHHRYCKPPSVRATVTVARLVPRAPHLDIRVRGCGCTSGSDVFGNGLFSIIDLAGTHSPSRSLITSQCSTRSVCPRGTPGEATVYSLPASGPGNPLPLPIQCSRRCIFGLLHDA